MSDNIESQVKDIIVEQLGVEADKVTLDAKFIEDLGADSLDIVELIMAFEEKFSIEVPEDAAEGLKSVSDVIEFINKSKAYSAESFPMGGPPGRRWGRPLCLLAR